MEESLGLIKLINSFNEALHLDKTYYSNNNNSSKAIQFKVKEELIISF